MRDDTVNLAAATGKLSIPVLAYGDKSAFGDIRAYWETVAENVEGGVVAECGHFIPEEKPAFVIDRAGKFFVPLAP